MSSPLTTQYFISRSVQEEVLPRSEASKKKHIEYSRQWKKDHRERVNELKRASRLRHRDHAVEKCRQWYYDNRDKQLDKKKRHYVKISELWGSIGLQHKWNDDIVARSEEYVSKEVIPKLGFHDILFVRPLVGRFPFDILAKDKDGKVCGFDVKLGIRHTINRNKKTLIDYLGVRHFIVHITRDMSFYVVKDMAGKRSSCAQGDFMDFVKKR